MPGFLAKLSASQYALKYRYTGNAADTAQKTQAQLVNDCAPGELKALLNNELSDTDWANLPLGGKLSVYVSNQASATLLATVFSGAPRKMVATSGALGSDAIIEIRLNHSVGF